MNQKVKHAMIVLALTAATIVLLPGCNSGSKGTTEYENTTVNTTETEHGNTLVAETANNITEKNIAENLYESEEDETWKQESWTLLEGSYKISTPPGYVITDTDDNSQIYVSMENQDRSVKVFGIAYTTVEKMVEEETSTTETTEREIIDSRDIKLADGCVLTYLVVHNTDKSDPMDVFDYYTYIGLIQEDIDVIEFWAISPSDELNYASTYVSFSNCISVPEFVLETFSEETE